MTADELLVIARRGRPTVSYTRNIQGTAIAARVGNEWKTVAMKLLDDEWGTVGDLFVNGEPVNKQADWVPDSELVIAETDFIPGDDE